MNGDETLVEAILAGGPDDLPPELRRPRVDPADAKIRVPHLGGHEHFERDPADPAGIVYRWSYRTRIAE